MANYKLSIITPEGQIFQEQVEALTAPGHEGFFGVQAQHAPMIAALKPGQLKIKTGSRERTFKIESGVLEIDSNHQVVVLVDQAAPV